MRDDKAVWKSRLSSWKRNRFFYILSCILMIVWLGLSSRGSRNGFYSININNVPFLIVLVVVTICAGILTINQLKLMKSILHVLEKPKMEDLGDLLEMRSDLTAWKSYLASTKGIQTNECLLSLMNEFNHSKSDSLTPAQIRSLSPILKSENVPLVLATLEVLERLGNAANLPQLRKLVAGDYPNSKNSAVKEVAL